MFETRPSSEISIPEALGGDSRFWAYVQLHLHLPWFYLIVGGAMSSEIVLATRAEQWLGFDDAYPGRRIESIQLVSPGWLNGSVGWKMEPLCQLWSATHKGSGAEATIYVVETGARYIDSLGSTSVEDELVDTVLMFEASAGKRRRKRK